MTNVVSIKKAEDMICCAKSGTCATRECMGWRTAYWLKHGGIKTDIPEGGAVEYGYCGLAGKPEE